MLSQPQYRTYVEIVLYRITLPICGHRGPLWPTLRLNIDIIIFRNRNFQVYCSKFHWRIIEHLFVDISQLHATMIKNRV